MFTSRETIVSCPGKVLIAGGYLVLDRTYPGIVVGTSSRFYTVIRPAPTPPDLPQEQAYLKYQQIRLSIRSPQFIDAEWSYLISLSPQADLTIKSDRSSPQNSFVELAVRESLKLSLALQTLDQFILHPSTTRCDQNEQPTNLSYPMTITILGDNDFYSQPRHDDAVAPFNRLNTTLKDVHKTGLGSSAAMVTSLCSAILVHFAPSIDPQSRSTKLLLHNLSQYVHSLAQGKVGSGFDVSAAVYGTHVYKRFSPSCLDGLLASSGDQVDLGPEQLRKALDPRINPSWMGPSTAPVIERFSLPKYTTLLLADVDAGSHTPSMVGQVFKWKNDETEIANQIWNELSIQNNQLKVAFERLDRLSNLDEHNYLSEVLKLSIDSDLSLQNDPRPVTETDDVRALFIKVSSTIKSIRQLMKKMGSRSNVPIEPDSQTQLLDECQKRHGVIGSGVPGAGGYDAIWVLVFTPPSLPDSSALARVEGRPGNKLIQNVVDFLKHWPHSSVKVLSPHSWVVGGSTTTTKVLTSLDDDCHDDDGIQIFNDLKLVDGLKSQLDLFS